MCIYLDGEVTNLFLTKITAKVPPLLVKLSVLIRIFRGRGPTPSHPIGKTRVKHVKGIFRAKIQRLVNLEFGTNKNPTPFSEFMHCLQSVPMQ